MQAAALTPILRKTGSVLLIVGLIDIAVMIYCVVNRIAYSSSFNIFAVVAGVFLFRGSVRAASAVRWFSVFLLAAMLSLMLAWPFVQPIDLTLTEIRLSPRGSAVSVVLLLGVAALLLWLQQQLGRAPVLAAHAALGRKARDMRVPAAGGVALVVLLTGALSLLLQGDSAAKAKSIAQQQVGAEFRYHVSSLSIAKNNQGTHVAAVVTAWNDKEVRDIPLEWNE
jgi:hypothetical protein